MLAVAERLELLASPHLGLASWNPDEIEAGASHLLYAVAGADARAQDAARRALQAPHPPRPSRDPCLRTAPKPGSPFRTLWPGTSAPSAVCPTLTLALALTRAPAVHRVHRACGVHPPAAVLEVG